MLKSWSVPMMLVGLVTLCGCNKWDDDARTEGYLGGEKERSSRSMSKAFYKEVEHDGRLLVIGTKEMYNSVKAGDPMPYEKTVIGAGPNGETVKFEIDKKDADLCDRLQTMFAEKHPFYREVEAHGRLHVIGTQDMYAKVLSGDPMPYEKTFIGAGPGGKTVKIQIDKKDHDLLPRLIAEFNKRHKTNL